MLSHDVCIRIKSIVIYFFDGNSQLRHKQQRQETVVSVSSRKCSIRPKIHIVLAWKYKYKSTYIPKFTTSSPQSCISCMISFIFFQESITLFNAILHYTNINNNSSMIPDKSCSNRFTNAHATSGSGSANAACRSSPIQFDLFLGRLNMIWRS